MPKVTGPAVTAAVITFIVPIAGGAKQIPGVAGNYEPNIPQIKVRNTVGTGALRGEEAGIDLAAGRRRRQVAARGEHVQDLSWSPSPATEAIAAASKDRQPNHQQRPRNQGSQERGDRGHQQGQATEPPTTAAKPGTTGKRRSRPPAKQGNRTTDIGRETRDHRKTKLLRSAAAAWHGGQRRCVKQAGTMPADRPVNPSDAMEG